VEKFSRWLRTICSINLARNTVADRLKAIGYVEQALNVMEDYHDPGHEEVWCPFPDVNPFTRYFPLELSH